MVVETALAELARCSLPAVHAVAACLESGQTVLLDALELLRSRAVAQAFSALSGASLLDWPQIAVPADSCSSGKGTGRVVGEVSVREYDRLLGVGLLLSDESGLDMSVGKYHRSLRIGLLLAD